MTKQRIEDAKHVLIWEAALNLVDQRQTGARFWKQAIEIMKRRIPGIKSDMRWLKAAYEDQLTAKCEKCERTVKYLSHHHPKDWSQCGASKYGKRYQKSGLAWWCPKHSKDNYLPK